MKIIRLSSQKRKLKRFNEHTDCPVKALWFPSVRSCCTRMTPKLQNPEKVSWLVGKNPNQLLQLRYSSLLLFNTKETETGKIETNQVLI